MQLCKLQQLKEGCTKPEKMKQTAFEQECEPASEKKVKWKFCGYKQIKT